MKDYKTIINALLDQASETQLRLVIWFIRGLLDPQDREKKENE